MLRIPRGLSGGFRAQLGRFPAIQRLFYSVGSTAGPNGAFEVVAKQTIPELAVDGTLFVHKATRATLLSLKSHQDDNKVFGAAFRTPPTDSSGVAHIIEHSVLCGSRKYPLKEPFAELIKSSLQVCACTRLPCQRETGRAFAQFAESFAVLRGDCCLKYCITNMHDQY